MEGDNSSPGTALKLPSIKELDKINYEAANVLKNSKTITGIPFPTKDLTTIGKLLRSSNSPYPSFRDIVAGTDGNPPMAIFEKEEDQKDFQQHYGIANFVGFRPLSEAPEKEFVTIILYPALLIRKQKTLHGSMQKMATSTITMNPMKHISLLPLFLSPFLR